MSTNSRAFILHHFRGTFFPGRLPIFPSAHARRLHLFTFACSLGRLPLARFNLPPVAISVIASSRRGFCDMQDCTALATGLSQCFCPRSPLCASSRICPPQLLASLYDARVTALGFAGSHVLVPHLMLPGTLPPLVSVAQLLLYVWPYLSTSYHLTACSSNTCLVNGIQTFPSKINRIKKSYLQLKMFKIQYN